jgi:photosystem II stability/assembly factor-like uncharacterized protein
MKIQAHLFRAATYLLPAVCAIPFALAQPSATLRPRPTPHPRPTPVGQWSPVDSGTTSNLNGAFLLDSGTGFIVGDTGTILKTTDAGATWASLISGTTMTLHDVYCFDPNDAVAVGDQGLILRTTDGGAVWESVASGVTDNLTSVSFSGTNGICGGDSQTILFSCDSGASWLIIQNDLFGGGFPGAQMLNPTNFFTAGQNSTLQPWLNEGQIIVSQCPAFGAGWGSTSVDFDNNEGSCTDIFFFDQTAGVVSGTLIDGRGALARTTDGGFTWSTVLYDQAIEGITFEAPASGFAVGAGGRILHSTDLGVTWIDQSSGTSANLNRVSFTNDALTGITVGEGGIILRTTPTPTPRPTSTPRVTPHPRPTPPDSGRYRY